MHSPITFSTLSTIFLSTVITAAEQHSQEDISNTVISFVENHYKDENSDKKLKIAVNGSERRINVPACNTPLEAFWPYDPGNQRTVSVGVRCIGQSRWKIYLQAELQLIEKIAVLNTPVRSGDVLDSTMVSTRSVNVLDLRSQAIKDVHSYVGMRFTRSLRSGTPLSRGVLEIPAVIKRGDYINILSGKGAVEVAAKGYALADGYPDDTIKVRNTDSKKVIQALVIDQGYVRTLR